MVVGNSLYEFGSSCLIDPSSFAVSEGSGCVVFWYGLISSGVTAD